LTLIDLTRASLKHIITTERWAEGEDTSGPPSSIVRSTNNGKTVVIETWLAPHRPETDPPDKTETKPVC